jgi:hypothetical protein
LNQDSEPTRDWGRFEHGKHGSELEIEWQQAIVLAFKTALIMALLMALIMAFKAACPAQML